MGSSVGIFQLNMCFWQRVLSGSVRALTRANTGFLEEPMQPAPSSPHSPPPAACAHILKDERHERLQEPAAAAAFATVGWHHSQLKNVGASSFSI